MVELVSGRGSGGRPGRSLAALVCALGAPLGGCFDIGAAPPELDAAATDAAPAVACPSTDPLDAGSVTLSGDVQPIFDLYCTAGVCHSAAIAAAGQVLAAGVAYMSIVGVPALETAGTSAMNRVEPFDPDASYLVYKITGTHLDPPASGSGERMPRGFADCLAPDQIGVIRAWIEAGALDD